jgi:RimJ/RimL family protein N-acetyltransferase
VVHGHARVEIEGWTFLSRSHWGGHCNTEMKQLMLRHAFRFVDTVLFFVGPQNVRSQKALERIGDIRIAPRPDRHDGNSFVFAITRASTMPSPALRPTS